MKDPGRIEVRAQLLETLSKDLGDEQLQQLVEKKTSQNLGNTKSTEYGESSLMDVVEVSVQLETLIFAKFADSNSPNYKTLSKKIIQGLKTRQDQRQQLLNVKDQHELEDFLQSYLSARGGRGPQQNESSGGGAAQANQSNPFAVARPGAGPGAGPTTAPQRRPPGPPQNRFPQQRFTVGNMYTSAMPQQQPSEQEQANQNTQRNEQLGDNINKIETQDPQNNQQVEEVKPQHQRNEMPVQDMAESGAADSSVVANQESHDRQKSQPKTQLFDQPPAQSTNQQFTDEFDFFNSLAQTAVQQQQQQFEQQHIVPHNQFQPHQDQFQNFAAQQVHQEHQQQEEQSRGDGANEASQRIEFEEEKKSIPQTNQNNQEEQQQVLNIADHDESGDRRISYKEEGRVFGSQANLEQEEGLQKQSSVLDNQASQIDQQQQKDNRHEFQHIQYQREEEELRPRQISDQKPKQSMPLEFSEQSQMYLRTEESMPKLDFYKQGYDRKGTEIQHRQSPSALPQMHSQSISDFHKMTPSVRGFIPISSSRPPQSVASVNITNLEDSEALIRAYKKKKSELEEVKQKFYEMDTEFFIIKQKNQHLQDENQQLRQQATRTERLLKDIQMKEQRTDSDKDLVLKQLQLKTSQIETYQKEINNQKQEITKLRERIKEMMSRSRQPVFAEGQESGANTEILAREREELKLQIQRYQQDLQNLTSQLTDLQSITHQRQQQEQSNLQQTEANFRQQMEAQKKRHDQEMQAMILQIKQLQQENKTLQDTNTSLSLKKSPQQTEKFEGESFVNIQKDSPELETDFGGYYEYKGSSSESKQKQNESLINQSYIKQHDVREKLSSAPASHTKAEPPAQIRQPQQPVAQKVVQAQSKVPQQQFTTVQQFQDESSTFFDQLSSNFQPQQRSPQQPLPQQQQQMRSQQLQQPLQPQQQLPQQPQQVRPPAFNQPPPMSQARPPKPQSAANAYSFSLDEISFEQQPKPPIKPPAQQQQLQQQRPQQQTQQQQRPMQVPAPSQNIYQFMDDDDMTLRNAPTTTKMNAGNAIVIPQSLFD